MSVFHLRYQVVELRLFTGDGGKAELNLGLGETEPGTVLPEMRKANFFKVYVSSLRVAWSLLHITSGSQMRDTVGCSKNDYSTPTVNNNYSSSACTVSNLVTIPPCV